MASEEDIPIWLYVLLLLFVLALCACMLFIFRKYQEIMQLLKAERLVRLNSVALVSCKWHGKDGRELNVPATLSAQIVERPNTSQRVESKVEINREIDREFHFVHQTTVQDQVENQEEENKCVNESVIEAAKSGLVSNTGLSSTMSSINKAGRITNLETV
jgi:hypothetical protein